MEPMNLGSPQSSPPVNPNFLPPFLIGDTPTTSPTPMVSPGRNKTPVFNKNFNSNPTNLRQKLFNNTIADSPVSQTMYNSTEVRSGPPKQGLFDSLDKQVSPRLNCTIGGTTIDNKYQDKSASFNESFRPIESTNCDTIDGRYSRIDTLWVTVFGFSPSSSSLVLAQLATCGPIAEKKIPIQGNWMHVKFNSYHEVARALLLNGKLISNCLMIGVTPYHNRQENNKENLEAHNVVSPNRARSLRHSFVTPHASNTVVSPQNVPHRSTGLVTKTLEYVFGW